MDDNSLTPRRSRRKKNKSWLPWILLIASLFLAVAAGAIFASSSLFDKPDTAKNDKLMSAKDKTIVMLMGVDQREDDIGRSDTLMIATIDPKKKKAALLSIPRDTRVKIKGHGFDKINSAFAYGGYKLTQDTVEKLLGVRMEHYIMIDVHAFQRIIDAIGGVDVDVEKRMYYEDPWDDDGGLVIDLYPGEQHMDGKTAMTYVRYRDEEGDIGRIARQQKFMQAAMDKLSSPAIITKLPAIIKEIFNAVETDLSLKQMLEFAVSVKDAQKNGLSTEMVPGKPMYIDEVSYWIPDVTKLRFTVADTLGVTMSSVAKSAMEEESLEYERSIPADAKNIPIDSDTVRRMMNGSDTSKSKITDKDKLKDKDDKSSEDDNELDEKSENDDNPYPYERKKRKNIEPADIFTDNNSKPSVSNTPSSPSRPSSASSPSVPSPNTSSGKTR